MQKDFADVNMHTATSAREFQSQVMKAFPNINNVIDTIGRLARRLCRGRMIGRVIADVPDGDHRLQTARPFSKTFDGIFTHLSQQCRGNVHVRQLVKISTNDAGLLQSNLPQHAADLHEGIRLSTRGGTLPAMLISNFTENRHIRPTGDSIPSNWMTLDNHIDCDELNGPRANAHWRLEARTEGFAALRLMMTGNNWEERKHLMIEVWKIY
jgi:hypothetical protein